MDQAKIDYSILSISSPHINTGEASSTFDLATEVNEYATTQHNKYPDKIGFSPQFHFLTLTKAYQRLSKSPLTAKLRGLPYPLIHAAFILEIHNWTPSCRP